MDASGGCSRVCVGFSLHEQPVGTFGPPANVTDERFRLLVHTPCPTPMAYEKELDH
jgi:hypothetical protein